MGLSCFTSAQAIKTFDLIFEKDGSRQAWIDIDSSTEKPSEPISVKKKNIELAAPENVNGKSVYVHNLKTNKVAKASLLTILKTGSWKPTEQEFSLTFSAKINIGNAKGKVKAGALAVTAGGETRSILLDENSNGEAMVYLLPGKEATVKFTTNLENGESITQTENLDLTGNEVPVLTIIASDQVPVILPESTSSIPKEGQEVATQSDQTVEKPATGSPIQTMFNMVVALLIIGGLGYGIWWYINNNQGQVEELVKKAGLNPQSNNDPIGTIPIEPTEPEPLKQIVLDPIAAPISEPNIASPSPEPKLYLPSGASQILNEGDSTIGRENATITLAGESSVSRLHAKIVRTGSNLVLEDLGSTNGTYLNGKKLENPVPIQPGDIIQVGTVQIRFEA